MRATHKTSNIVPIRNELLYWLNEGKRGGLNTKNTAPFAIHWNNCNAMYENSNTPGALHISILFLFLSVSIDIYLTLIQSYLLSHFGLLYAHLFHWIFA